MPRINARGSVVCGVAGGPASIDGRVVAQIGGCAQWLDDDAVIVFNGELNGVPRVCAYDTRTGVTLPLSSLGANELAAGGGSWLAWNRDGVFGPTYADQRAGLAKVDGDQRGAAGPDGTIAVIPNRQIGTPTNLIGPSGELVASLPGVVRDLRILPFGRALWRDDARKLSGYGLRLPALPWPAEQAWWVDVPGDVAWLIYYSSALGVVGHPVDSVIGVLIVPPGGLAYYLHARRLDDGRIKAAWAARPGEYPEDLRTCEDIRALPRVDLTALARQPLTSVGRRIWFGWYVGSPGAAGSWNTTDRGDGLPRNCRIEIGPDFAKWLASDGTLLGQYVQGASDSNPFDIAAAIVAARAARPTVPVIAYWPRQAVLQDPTPPAADVVAVEWYRLASEIDAQFEARCRTAVALCLARGRRVLGIPQAYDSNATLTTDLSLIPPIASRILADTPAIEGAICFSGTGRGRGVNDRPDALPPWREIFASIPGAPAIVRPPAPPPTPPPRPPAPPPPADPFGSVTIYRIEDAMQTERGGLVGARGKFVRVDPHQPGKGLFGGFPVIVDADSSDGDAEWELSQPDVRFTLTHVATGQILGMDATQFSVDLTKQYYTKPPDQRGGYESPFGVRLPSGTVIFFVEYDTDAQGKPQHFLAAPLVWVKR